MKKAAFALILILFFCFSSSAKAQDIGFGSRGAICPFKWEGDIWRTDMGTLLAEEIYKRIRSIRQIYFIPTDETRQMIVEARIENAWNMDPEDLRKAFWDKKIRVVVSGKIESIHLIRDVDGSSYADVEIRFNVIDTFEAAALFNETVKYRTKAAAYITAETPYDRDVALSILNGGVNRAVGKIRAGLERYYRSRRTPRIF